MRDRTEERHMIAWLSDLDGLDVGPTSEETQRIRKMLDRLLTEIDTAEREKAKLMRELEKGRRLASAVESDIRHGYLYGTRTESVWEDLLEERTE